MKPHMCSIFVGASLAALALAGHTYAAEPAKAASEAPKATEAVPQGYVTITVPDADVQAYAAALQELPMKVAQPIYARLGQAYQKAKAPSQAPAPSPAPAAKSQ